MQKWQCRVAPSLGDLESTHDQIWGTVGYYDLLTPTVFFGLYGLPDFYALWRHKGKKAILWAGSDIIHFKNGYWLEDKGKIRVKPGPLAEWINQNCENFVENKVEFENLRKVGIDSKIVPSFLGDVNQFDVSFKPGKVKLYASVSGDNFNMYGWFEINELAEKYPDYEFHLYGNTKPWRSKFNNVRVHGRVPKEVMNAEIKEMTGAIRLLKHDGFSEVLAKSILMGQWPVATIPYDHMLTPDQLGELRDKDKPNLKGREHYLKLLNKYPWVNK